MIHTYIFTFTYTGILFQILSPYGLLQTIGYCSFSEWEIGLPVVWEEKEQDGVEGSVHVTCLFNPLRLGI